MIQLKNLPPILVNVIDDTSSSGSFFVLFSKDTFYCYVVFFPFQKTYDLRVKPTKNSCSLQICTYNHEHLGFFDFCRLHLYSYTQIILQDAHQSITRQVLQYNNMVTEKYANGMKDDCIEKI